MDMMVRKNNEELQHFLRRLARLLEPHIEEVSFPKDDHFAFMSMCFLTRQYEHAGSILTLGNSFDVDLIARSMLEGLCLLLWAAVDPADRAYRWRAFSAMHDHDLLRKRETWGEEIDEEERIAVQQRWKAVEHLFLTNAAKCARARGEPDPPRPYHKNWFGGQTVRDLCQVVGAERLYDGPYNLFSEWHHWGVGGIGRSLERDAGRVVFSIGHGSPTAYAVAILSLLQTSVTADERVGLGIGEYLQEFRTEYVDQF